MLEAILVALLVLTAILFFTSVQRPSTGQGGSGGLDLSQVSADTLQILQARTFTVSSGSPNAGTLTFEQWMTNLASGDSATATVLNQFLAQVLPTGSTYQLRLNNGVSQLTLLPLTATSQPQAARASEIMFVPAWATFEVQTTTDSAAPLQAMTSTANPVLSRFTDPNDIRCIKPPSGASSGTIGSTGPFAATWTSLWQPTVASMAGVRAGGTYVVTGLSTTAALVPGMHVAGTGVPASATISSIDSGTQITLSASSFPTASSSTLTFYANRIPGGVPYGTWAGYTDASCSTGAIYAKVVRPECSVSSPPTGCTSNYSPYGLQLVVWFGA